MTDFSDVNVSGVLVVQGVNILEAINNAPAGGCTNHPNAAGIAALMSDIVYWSQDLYQHCIFHEFAITNNAPLLARAQELANPHVPWDPTKSWPDFINGNPPGIPPYDGGLVAARILAVKTRDLEQDIFNQMQQPGIAGFVGWLSQDIYKHCIAEANAWIDTIDGKVWAPQELRDLWWTWNAEHAGNGPNFLSAPSAASSANQSRAFEAEFYKQRDQMIAIGTGGTACSCELDTAAAASGVGYKSFLDGLHVGAGAPQQVPSTYIQLVIDHIKAETDAANQMLTLLGCAP